MVAQSNKLTLPPKWAQSHCENWWRGANKTYGTTPKLIFIQNWNVFFQEKNIKNVTCKYLTNLLKPRYECINLHIMIKMIEQVTLHVEEKKNCPFKIVWFLSWVMCARLSACVCVCVRERESEREREGGGVRLDCHFIKIPNIYTDTSNIADNLPHT